MISWELDHTLEMPFVLTAVERALSVAMPIIWKSDRGGHCIGQEYQQLLREAQVQISMESKSRALDNIFTERLWRTVKDEEVSIHDYLSPKEARQQLSAYFEFYNHRHDWDSENGARGEAARSVARLRADTSSNKCNIYALAMRLVDNRDNKRSRT